MLSRIVGFVALLFLAGCGAGSSIVVGTTREPIDPSQVRIYLRAPANYEEVAVVEADSFGSFAVSNQGRTDSVIERMKKKAAALGANGILITSTGKSGGGASVTTVVDSQGHTATGITSAGMVANGTGIAIYVPEQ
jgi:hypothetical protein